MAQADYQLLSSILDTSSDFLFVKDLELRTLVCNKACAAALGKQPEDLVGKTDIENGWDPAKVLGDPSKGIRGYEEDDLNALAGRTIHAPTETILLAGKLRSFDTVKQPLRDAEGTIIGMLGISRDITDRVEIETTLARREAELAAANNELRNLASHLIGVREEERRRVARDIHDDLGQRLTAMSLGLHWIADRVAADPETLRSEIEELIETNRDTISAVQGLAAQLRPHLLDDLGIGAALDWLVGDIGKRGGTRISVSCELGERGLDPDIAITLFRIVQESLGNVLRHASAKEATVRILSTGELLSLSITDDGVGISDMQRSNPGSFGIIGMKERVQLHGGSFSVLASPTGGTVVSVAIPLSAREDRKS